jgi:hypothetical protein
MSTEKEHAAGTGNGPLTLSRFPSSMRLATTFSCIAATGRRSHNRSRESSEPPRRFWRRLTVSQLGPSRTDRRATTDWSLSEWSLSTHARFEAALDVLWWVVCCASG